MNFEGLLSGALAGTLVTALGSYLTARYLGRIELKKIDLVRKNEIAISQKEFSARNLESLQETLIAWAATVPKLVSSEELIRVKANIDFSLRSQELNICVSRLENRELAKLITNGQSRIADLVVGNFVDKVFLDLALRHLADFYPHANDAIGLELQKAHAS